jgi:site-specific DNA-adenine methylase
VPLLDDWTLALAQARDGDLLFVDPPYGAFDQYTGAGFGLEDHHRLSIALERFLRSNPRAGLIAFNDETAQPLYRFADRIDTIARPGRINSNGSGRGDVAELLITHGLRTYATKALATTR